MVLCGVESIGSNDIRSELYQVWDVSCAGLLISQGVIEAVLFRVRTSLRSFIQIRRRTCATDGSIAGDARLVGYTFNEELCAICFEEELGALTRS
jgi:hypothetical protein